MTDPDVIEDLLAQYDESGMTQLKFAECAEVPHSTFASWLRKRRIRSQEADPIETASSPWIEASLPAAFSGRDNNLVVEFPNGIVLRVPPNFDPKALGSLIQTTGQTCLHWVRLPRSFSTPERQTCGRGSMV